VDAAVGGRQPSSCRRVRVCDVVPASSVASARCMGGARSLALYCGPCVVTRSVSVWCGLSAKSHSATWVMLQSSSNRLTLAVLQLTVELFRVGAFSTLESMAAVVPSIVSILDGRSDASDQKVRTLSCVFDAHHL
jgi:hypothetical protein